MTLELLESRGELLQCMLDSDRSTAQRVVEQLIGDNVPPRDILDQVLNPALVRLGALWGQESVSLSQAFVAGKIAEDTLATCLGTDRTSTGAPKGIAVMGNAEDDFHGLGRRIVSAFLAASGWEIHDLGTDVDAETMVDRAVETGASVIGVSAMMLATAMNIQRLRELLDQRGLSDRIKLAVGGAVFAWRPELADAVGADGTAANAAEAVELFDRLASECEVLR